MENGSLLLDSAKRGAKCEKEINYCGKSPTHIYNAGQNNFIYFSNQLGLTTYLQLRTQSTTIGVIKQTRVELQM